MANKKAWKIEPVVLADAPAIARNNVSAFWEDKHWRLSWEDIITLDYLIEQQTDKVPNDLLHRQDILRHLKAVDPDTGELVGYLRFALPVEHSVDLDGKPIWPEFQTTDVGPEERKRIQGTSDKAWYQPKDNGSEDQAFEIQKQILSEAIYIKLRYLAVHPENQRKGVAHALVKYVIEKARTLGVDIYIMAYEAGRPLYGKLDFKEIECNVVDMAYYGGEGEHTICFMIYHAKKGTE